MIPDITKLYIESLYDDDVVSIVYDITTLYTRIIIYTKTNTIFVYYDDSTDSITEPEHFQIGYEIFVRKHKLKKLLK